MNHDYKTKYEQMQDNQHGKAEDSANDALYPSAGYSRQINFVLSNGDTEAFNYSYLVRIRHVRDENAIYLIFTFCTVKIEGYNLMPLYLQLFDHRSRIIECIDQRYRSLTDDKPVVIHVTILDNK